MAMLSERVEVILRYLAACASPPSLAPPETGSLDDAGPLYLSLSSLFSQIGALRSSLTFPGPVERILYLERQSSESFDLLLHNITVLKRVELPVVHTQAAQHTGNPGAQLL